MRKMFNLLGRIDLSADISDKEKISNVKRLQHDFETGQISRRHFMVAALSLGVSMTAASSLLTVAEAATPKKGGRLRTGLTGGATSDSLTLQVIPEPAGPLLLVVAAFGRLFRRNRRTP